MSVQSSPVVRDPSPAPASPAQPEHATDPSFDARWAAWIERGRQHDRAMTRNVRFAVLTAAAIIGLLVAVFFGLTAGAR